MTEFVHYFTFVHVHVDKSVRITDDTGFVIAQVMIVDADPRFRAGRPGCWRIHRAASTIRDYASATNIKTVSPNKHLSVTFIQLHTVHTITAKCLYGFNIEHLRRSGCCY